VATAGAFVALSLPPGEAGAGGAFTRVDADGVVHITDAPTDRRFRSLTGDDPATAGGWLPAPAPSRGDRWGVEIHEISQRYGVDPQLVHAVIEAESAFNPWAVSPKGAQGLMQLMPRTASALGVRDSFDPRDNIEGGVRHLRYLLDRYPGDVSLALAAYNAGEGAVNQYGGIPPYRETQQYVQKILQRGVGAAAELLVPPAPPPDTIYRSEDADGTVVFSNIPPVGPGRRRR
jgi:hypothetical protein